MGPTSYWVGLVSMTSLLPLIVVDIGAAIARVPCVLRGETGGLGEVAWSPNGTAIALTNSNETVCSPSTLSEESQIKISVGNMQDWKQGVTRWGDR